MPNVWFVLIKPLVRELCLISVRQLIKAVIGIIYSGSFLSFIGEALNMRAAHATYRSLYQWVNQMESVGKHDKIDDDLRSGIFMGNGMISLMLSLLPSKALVSSSLLLYDLS